MDFLIGPIVFFLVGLAVLIGVPIAAGIWLYRWARNK